eukprot:TRINITY_DN4224_c0_g3_i1.p1 TRINITY_DN4224_c0_g3~~TRINITY_DN4224_c0_g3_i1.p1  ORF type:complete len:284 (+),score=37.64 TRINITY_DN4224_c0_g3_i1:18-869(+)
MDLGAMSRQKQILLTLGALFFIFILVSNLPARGESRQTTIGVDDQDYEQKHQLAVKRRNEKIKHVTEDQSQVKQWTSTPTVWYLFEATYMCPSDERRLGELGDKGRWTCGFKYLKKGCVIYIFGGGVESTYESDVLKNTPCEVHLFDQRLQSTPQLPKQVYLHRMGLSTGFEPGSDTHGQANSLRWIMNELGHDFVDAISIDVEFKEWAIFQHFAREKFYPFGQLYVELHYSSKFDELKNFFEHLEAVGFRSFHKEPNLFCKDCVRYAFIHRTESIKIINQMT